MNTSAVINPAEVFYFCHSSRELFQRSSKAKKIALSFNQESNATSDDFDIHWPTLSISLLLQSVWYNLCYLHLCFAL